LRLLLFFRFPSGCDVRLPTSYPCPIRTSPVPLYHRSGCKSACVTGSFFDREYSAPVHDPPRFFFSPFLPAFPAVNASSVNRLLIRMRSESSFFVFVPKLSFGEHLIFPYPFELSSLDDGAAQGRRADADLPAERGYTPRTPPFPLATSPSSLDLLRPPSNTTFSPPVKPTNTSFFLFVRLGPSLPQSACFIQRTSS